MACVGNADTLEDKQVCLGQSQPNVHSNNNLHVRFTHTERSIQSLIEVFSSEIDGIYTVPLWLEQAVQMRASSPLLCAAIEATSFVLMGKRASNPRLTHAGLVRYTCALRLAGTALYDPMKRLQDDVIVAITLFGMTEVGWPWARSTYPFALIKHADVRRRLHGRSPEAPTGRPRFTVAENSVKPLQRHWSFYLCRFATVMGICCQ
jgi:hypothetical protein